MKHILFSLILLLSFSSCSSDLKFYDEENKTIFIDGVSASDGKSAVIDNLISDGFVLLSTDTIDTTLLDGKIYFYSRLELKNPTKEINNRLTYGFFSDNIPYSNLTSIKISYLRDGSILQYEVNIYDGYIEDESTVMSINKKIASYFEKSKLGNVSQGFKTYYNESNNISLYYPNCYRFEIKLQ